MTRTEQDLRNHALRDQANTEREREMSEKDNGGPAFPFSPSDESTIKHSYGMTLRDYFAAHAPNPPEMWRVRERKLDNFIDWRWYYADAMLKVRKS